jgi:hypothetical protein
MLLLTGPFGDMISPAAATPHGGQHPPRVRSAPIVGISATGRSLEVAPVPREARGSSCGFGCTPRPWNGAIAEISRAGGVGQAADLVRSARFRYRKRQPESTRPSLTHPTA